MKIDLLTYVLLGGQCDHKDVQLPNNTEALPILKVDGIAEDSTTKDDIEINKLYVTLWLEKNKHTWYTGHCLSKNDNGTHKIEHLYRKRKNSEFFDIVDMNTKHIVSCEIVGGWDVSSDRCLVYTLRTMNISNT